jgi:hypothetical protein
MGLEWGPLSLVSTTEELLDRKVAAPVWKTENTGRRDPSRRPRGTPYPQKLAITSPTSGGRSVDIVRSRTQTMEFSFFVLAVTPDYGAQAKANNVPLSPVSPKSPFTQHPAV